MPESFEKDRDSKFRRALATAKHRVKEIQLECQFYHERCLELDLRVAREKLKKLPRKTRDASVYTGNELIERDFVIDKMLKEMARLHAVNSQLRQQLQSSQRAADKKERKCMYDSMALESIHEKFGTRFASQLEFGPSTSYSSTPFRD